MKEAMKPERLLKAISTCGDVDAPFEDPRDNGPLGCVHSCACRASRRRTPSARLGWIFRWFSHLSSKAPAVATAVLLFTFASVTPSLVPRAAAQGTRAFRPVVANTQTFTVTPANGGIARLDVSPLYAVLNVESGVVGASTQMKVSAVTALDPTLPALTVQGVKFETPVLLNFPVRVSINVGTLSGRSVLRIGTNGTKELCSSCVDGSLVVANLEESGESIIVIDTPLLAALDGNPTSGVALNDPIFDRLRALKAQNDTDIASGKAPRNSQAVLDTELARIRIAVKVQVAGKPTTFTDFRARSNKLVTIIAVAQGLGLGDSRELNAVSARLVEIGRDWATLLIREEGTYTPTSMQDFSRHGQRMIDTISYINTASIGLGGSFGGVLDNVEVDLRNIILAMALRTNTAVIVPQITRARTFGDPTNQSDFCRTAKDLLDLQAVYAALGENGPVISAGLTTLGANMATAFDKQFPEGVVTEQNLVAAQGFVSCAESLSKAATQPLALTDALAKAKEEIVKVVAAKSTTTTAFRASNTTTTRPASTTTTTPKSTSSTTRLATTTTTRAASTTTTRPPSATTTTRPSSTTTTTRPPSVTTTTRPASVTTTTRPASTTTTVPRIVNPATSTTTTSTTSTTLPSATANGSGLPSINCPATAQVYDLRSPSGARSPIDNKSGLQFLVAPGATQRLSSMAYPDGQNSAVTIDTETVPALSATGVGLTKAAGGTVVWRAMRYPRGDLYIEIFSSTGPNPRSITGTIGGTSCTLAIQVPQ
jgi:hypothetical protein